MYFKNIHSTKLENAKETDDFQIYDLLKFDQEKTNNLNMTTNEIETITKILPTKKGKGQMDRPRILPGLEELTSTLLKFVCMK